MNHLKRTLEPLSVIKLERTYFVIWLVFTVLAGQIGIITNIILRGNFKNFTLVESLLHDSINGSFYTYSIALFASTLGLLFVNIIEKNPTNFKTFKVYLLIITIFSLFFAGVYYSVSTLKTIGEIKSQITNICIDWPQLIFLILSIIFAIYTFSITRLDLNCDKYKHLDDNYAEKDDKDVEKLDDKVSEIKTDKKGNKL
jgi:hypothetical protein